MQICIERRPALGTIASVEDDRYQLVDGDPIWIFDTVYPDRNPLFRLSGYDGAYARRFLRNLNTRSKGGGSQVDESRPLTAVRQ
jgi:hypothetical protein